MTAPVEDELLGDIRVGLGNYDLVTVSGTLNAPIIDDKQGIRINAGIRQRDGWQKNVVRGDRDGFEQDRWNVRAKLKWTPTDNVDVLWASDWREEDDHSGYYSLYDTSFPREIFNPVVFDSESEDAAAANLAVGTDTPEGAPLDFGLNREIEGHSLKVLWDISDSLSLTSITSYRKLDYAIEEDNDGTEYLMLNVRSFADGAKEYTQEFRLNGKSDSFDWFVGANYYGQETLGSVEDSFGSYLVGVPVTEANIVESEVDSLGLFGDVIWSVNDRINITLGARYSYDEKSQDILPPLQDSIGAGVNVVFPTAEQLTDENGVPDPSLASLEDDWDDLSLRGIVDYQLNDDSMVFISVSEGYKAGGFNSFPIVDLGEFFPYTTPGQLVPYDEEKVTNFELGLKSEFLENTLRINGSIYSYVWEDLQVQVARGAALFTINAGEAVGQGIDLELTYLATDGLTLTAAYVYLDAEYNESVSGSGIEKGDPLLYAPEHSATLGLDYFVGLSDTLNLRTHVGYNYVGSQYLSPGIEGDSYSLLNARLSLLTASDSWEVSLWGRNLTDETYLDSVTDFMDALGYISARRNEPRTYGAEVTYRF